MLISPVRAGRDRAAAAGGTRTAGVRERRMTGRRPRTTGTARRLACVGVARVVAARVLGVVRAGAGSEERTTSGASGRRRAGPAQAGTAGRLAPRGGPASGPRVSAVASVGRRVVAAGRETGAVPAAPVAVRVAGWPGVGRASGAGLRVKASPDDHRRRLGPGEQVQGPPQVPEAGAGRAARVEAGYRAPVGRGRGRIPVRRGRGARTVLGLSASSRRLTRDVRRRLRRCRTT